MTEKISKEAASRIQSNADRTRQNQDFARRVQSAADKGAAQQSKSGKK